MTTADERQAIWDAWNRGESRCPYCIDEDDGTFKALCDCWRYDQEQWERAMADEVKP